MVRQQALVVLARRRLGSATTAQYAHAWLSYRSEARQYLCRCSCRVQVHFVNAQGVAEAGIDHGGLMKELLEATVAAGCQPEYGLFAAAEGSNLVYPNPAAEAIPQGLALLEFLGG
eukprot:GHRQ01012500.1.p6 GENE.GHRQ01012500.1~~GHRQ01012500.1.p6  ORF type:complete len:116 (-),score=34.52 GHRQ01012500.1:2004-2351(-)